MSSVAAVQRVTRAVPTCEPQTGLRLIGVGLQACSASLLPSGTMVFVDFFIIFT